MSMSIPGLSGANRVASAVQFGHVVHQRPGQQLRRTRCPSRLQILNAVAKLSNNLRGRLPQEFAEKETRCRTSPRERELLAYQKCESERLLAVVPGGLKDADGLIQRSRTFAGE